MKVIHVESGLGNQMLSYAEYLVMKKLNDDDCYIENMIYDIEECNDVICQWFGYELERIFNIKAPNVKTLFSENQWDIIISDVKRSEFWNNGWRYAPAITNAFRKQGVELDNILGDDVKYVKTYTQNDSKIKYDLKRILRPFYEKKYIKSVDMSHLIFVKSNKNIYAGQTLGLRNTGVDIDYVKDEIKDAFRFPQIEDEKNKEISKMIKNCESVAIHARRGDMLQSNGYCYKYGYFKRAVKYIRNHVANPVFFFFCDTGSIEWCKSNPNIFGLDFDKDKVFFIDWNTGLEYYRDMQLMAMCKHNIITNSSFGWWGAYFNENPQKVTCSPSVWINTTNHM